MSIESAFDDHARLLMHATPELIPLMHRVAVACTTTLKSGGKLLVCGNGGSAADAQHFAAELVGRYRRERGPLAAIALTTDTSALTAIANDYGYDQVFARQVDALARRGDLLVAISTSGNSKSILIAAERARALGCTVVGMTGQGGGELAAVVDLLVDIPSTTVARIQELHELCLHSLAEEIENVLVDALEISR